MTPTASATARRPAAPNSGSTADPARSVPGTAAAATTATTTAVSPDLTAPGREPVAPVGVLRRLRLATPAGPLTVLADADGVVRASGFAADDADLLALLPTAARPSTIEDGQDGDPALAGIAAAVGAYVDGRLDALDAIPVHQAEPPATAALRRELRAVAPGRPCSYRELAERAGLPRGSRAAGQACARNAVAPFVPCHRVLRSDGALGGYRWGLEVKRRLLDHEARHAG